MAFAGFSRGIQEEFNGWCLPDRIVKEFNLRLIHDLPVMSPLLLEQDYRGMRYSIVIQDCEHPGTYYQFLLRIVRNDMDFWCKWLCIRPKQ